MTHHDEHGPPGPAERAAQLLLLGLSLTYLAGLGTCHLVAAVGGAL